MFKSIYSFLILFCFCSCQKAFSQGQTITIRANRYPLPTLLREIQDKSQYSIIYSNEIVTDSLKASIDLQNRPVSEILNIILAPHQLFYSFRDQRLILIGSKQPLTPSAAFSRKPLQGVVNDENHQPIAYATVALYQNNRKLTDQACSEAGRFLLDFPFQQDSSYELKISSVNYLAKNIRFVYPDSTNLHSIELIRHTGTLKEANVNANRPLVERQIDRLVFNVSNSIA